MSGHSTIISDYVGLDVAANRASTPNIATKAGSLFFASDTGVFSVWDGSAWINVTTTGTATAAGLISSNGTVLEATTLTGGASWSNGTLEAAAAPAASGVVFSNGTILEQLTLSANFSLTGSTLSLTGVALAPSAGLVFSNGTTLGAATVTGGITYSGGTVSLSAITAGIVSSDGTILEPTTVVGASWATGTLTIHNQGSGIAAGLVSTNGTVLEATTLVGATWSGSTLTIPPGAGGVALIGGVSGTVALSTDFTVTGQTISITGGPLQGMAFQSASSVVITGGTITGLSTPTSPSDAATKSYVDASVQGLQVKQTAVVASTGSSVGANTYSNGTLGVGATLTMTSTGTLTIDGYVTQLGDVILVKDQPIPSHNGLFVVTTAGAIGVAAVLTRHTDMDQATEFSGAFIPVGNTGSINANSLWLANPTTPVVVGTTNIPFTQVNGATDLSAGNSMTISGNTVSVTSIAGGLVSSNGTILEATTISGSNLNWSGSTLSLSGLAALAVPSAGIVYSNGTILGDVSFVGGASFSGGTLTAAAAPGAGVVVSNGTVLSTATIDATLTYTGSTLALAAGSNFHGQTITICGIAGGAGSVIGNGTVSFGPTWPAMVITELDFSNGGTAGGTITADVQINGTNVTGLSAVTVSSTSSAAASGANTITAGSTPSIILSALSGTLADGSYINVRGTLV